MRGGLRYHGALPGSRQIGNQVAGFWWLMTGYQWLILNAWVGPLLIECRLRVRRLYDDDPGSMEER